MTKVLGIISFCIGIFFFLLLLTGSVIEGEKIILKICLFFIGLGIIFIVLSIILKKRKKSNLISQNDILAKKKELRQQTIEMITSGTMDPITDCSIILKPNETAYLEYNAVLIISQNKLLGTTGKSAGTSMRVAKGLYLHSGSSGSRKIYGEVNQQYPGIFSVTNQRMSFLNPQKGFEIPLSKLTSITSSLSTLILQQANRTYTLEITNADIVEHLIRKLI